MSDETIARGMRSNRHPLDEDSAARLLQGVVHADDAPPGYGSVAALLAVAAARPALDEDAGAETIAAMVEAIRSTSAPATAARKSLVGKLFAGKALAAVAVVALTASGAAAATGTLPSPVQDAVADAVSHVGVGIPHPNHGKSAEHRQDADHRQDTEHRQDGKDRQSGEHRDQPARPDQADSHGQPTSDAAHDAKTGATESGDKVGPAVCSAVGSNCQPETQGPTGPPEDKGTPDTSRSDNGQPGEPAKPVENNGQGEDHATTPTSPTTPTTGGIATGEDRSGRDLPSPRNAKSGKPAN